MNTESPYITDPIEYVKFKHKHERAEIELEVLIDMVKSDSSLLERAISEMNDRNERLYQQRSEIMAARNKTKKARKKSKIQGQKNVENGTYGTTELALKGVESQIENGVNLFLSPEMEHHRLRGSRKALKIQKEKGLGFYDPTIQKKGTLAGNKIIKCKYCGLERDLRNIKQHHNEKCKQKPEDMKRVLNLLDNIFNEKQWKIALKKSGFNYTPKASRIILSHEIYMTKLEGSMYCKKNYKPTSFEIQNFKEKNPNKATKERLEKANKLKCLLKGEFTGKQMHEASLKLGYTGSFGRSLLGSDICPQVYKGIPGSKTNVSRYVWTN